MITALLIIAVYCLIGYLWYKIERARHPDQFEDEGDDASDDECSVDWWLGLIWPLCVWVQIGDWLRGLRKRI